MFRSKIATQPQNIAERNLEDSEDTSFLPVVRAYNGAKTSIYCKYFPSPWYSRTLGKASNYSALEFRDKSSRSIAWSEMITESDFPSNHPQTTSYQSILNIRSRPPADFSITAFANVTEVIMKMLLHERSSTQGYLAERHWKDKVSVKGWKEEVSINL
ncbi:hypothetical protein N7478_003773 [Penicillium angulare]|uniref:uncharacterized protein n=1 Tax=Penicillium angulare TaxID=116970 RepID=UPI00254159EE|nr:uncharacterized protein N7478_010134 [Penicillium angulare]XP_056775805.1 uncharacterized protein N7478_010221 [Penicillium angulare]XP_056783145.1 uncharacterized protein N7478_003773 [Penicillium angulare]KAJ5267326.1 hypothetical protein N7478_010134 [Penicillium angulare]KAJ5267413.1 hypothetical protein N7478_010221 [Penicillium angulare]KAJ5288087.1 hypothetical protein N7478_003773 [Penicillium angulare]